MTFSGVFSVSLKHISHIFLVLLLLTWEFATLPEYSVQTFVTRSVNEITELPTRNI